MTELQEHPKSAGKNFNYERAANVLVTAFISDDREASRKFGVCTRTIKNYRQKLGKDDYLTHLFLQKKEQYYEEEFSIQIRITMLKYLEFVCRTCDNIEVGDPKMIIAVTQAFKAISETYLTEKIINARLEKELLDLITYRKAQLFS